MQSRFRGFTLIEMMVVVTIAAVMLGLGVPSFRSFIVGQRVKTAASDFAMAAIYARSEAIKRNTDVVLAAAAGGWPNGWSVTYSISGTTYKLSQQEAFPGGVLIASLPPKVTATQVTYQSSGRLGAAVDDLQFSGDAGSYARCISFDLSGLPKSRLGGC